MFTANQSLKPLTYRINEKEHVVIGGCDLVDVANEYGTPLYVFDEFTIRKMCREYKEAFSKYPNLKPLYASKACMNKAIAKIVASEGFGFDVVSAGEIYTVQKTDIDLSTVLFNGSNKSFDELTMAVELGVGRVSVDNLFELSLLNEIAKSHDKTVDILLRITPGIECHTHEYIQTGHLDSKFGFDLTQLPQAIELIIDEYHNLNLKGLHAHIGSQIFETKIYKDEVELLVKEICELNKKYGITLNEINLGGGIGVKYTESDEPPCIYDVADLIINSLNKCIEKYDIEPPIVYIEPGRSIISTAGVTLYTLGSSKQVPNGRKYWAVDGGMADNPRPSMYQAEYSAEVANKPKYSLTQQVTIAGRFCESGDVLIKNFHAPELQEGDILCVYNTGSYNFSMESNYNRVQKLACVLVNNSQSDIIVLRETLDDLVSRDKIPERLEK